ncbi:MAG: hypothetical protein IKK29_04410, partial [Christensenellaceae bacterium]|nr:hypothetical protein [Christensenellaceae bacterium]
SKELTLLDKLFFSVLASCTVFSLFNELPLSFFLAFKAFFKIPFFERGCKGTHYFQTSKSFERFF